MLLLYLILPAMAYLIITLKAEWGFVLSEFMLHLAVWSITVVSVMRNGCVHA